MKIIVVGCGKVGREIAMELANEGNEVTVIDKNHFKVEEISNKCDVMGVVGNGVSYQTQAEVGIQSADLMIAMTGSDEINLLCCLIAKRAGDCKTIARVRNPEYSNEVTYVKDALGLSLAINPEYAAAKEISEILRFPSAIQIDTFARGRVELLKFRVGEGVSLAGMKVSEVVPKLKVDVLICAVERGSDELYIPGGDFQIQENDLVSIIVRPQKAGEFFKKIGIETHQVKDVMIVGGGDTAYYLARLLRDMNISIKLIERDEDRCDYLSDELPHAQIIHGDGSDQIVLMEEGLKSCEGFVALTGIDEENVILSLYAKQQSNAKICTRLRRANFDGLIRNLDLDTIVYTRKITAEYIVQFVRAMKNSIGCNMERMYKIMDERAEAVEFTVERGSHLIGIPLMNLTIHENTLVACIIRGKKILIPRGQDTLEEKDSVVIVTMQKGIRDISEIIDVQ